MPTPDEVKRVVDALRYRVDGSAATLVDGPQGYDQAEGLRDQQQAFQAEAEALEADAQVLQSDAPGLTQYADLDALTADLALSNVVDVCVYDTSQDSDGGAWRTRCQHTSWYQEDLNTILRGATREFPTVALIVLTQNELVIYDATDVTLPMWMHFRHSWSYSQGKMLLLMSNRATAVAIKNARLCVTSSDHEGEASGIIIVDFLVDRAWMHQRYGSGSTFTRHPNIAARDEDLGRTSTGGFDSIVDNYVNDVAMTVLPNAPIDPTTGLAVPTVAVATEGGVSVIQHDGTVVDKAANINTYSHHSKCENVMFKDGLLYVTVWSDTQKSLVVYTPDLSEKLFEGTSYSGHSNYDLRLCQKDSGINDITDGALAFTQGLTQVSALDGIVAYQDPKYCTGWMPGNIQGAWLASTDNADLVEEQMVDNSTFTANVDGWQAYDVGEISWDDGSLRLERLDYGALSGRVLAYQHITGLTVGRKYRLRITVHYEEGHGSLSMFAEAALRDDLDDAGYHVQVGTPDTDTLGINTPVTRVVEWVATTTSTYVTLGLRNTSTGNLRFDEVKLETVDTDRTAASNSLLVNGRVVKEPVAPGAELMSYTAMSRTNGYLYTDLDEAPGDEFSILCWVNHASSDRAIFSLGDVNDKDAMGGLYAWVNGAQIKTRVDGRAFSNTGGLPSPNKWWLYALTLKNGTMRQYINGVERSTFNMGTTVLTQSRLNVGAGHYSNNTGEGLSLFRYSKTAPTSEQIARIYEDEKSLFEPNAKCTVYGNNDKMLAVARDPSTGLLYAGTSEGLSVFNGLRRVDQRDGDIRHIAANGLVVTG